MNNYLQVNVMKLMDIKGDANKMYTVNNVNLSTICK